MHPNAAIFFRSHLRGAVRDAASGSLRDSCECFVPALCAHLQFPMANPPAKRAKGDELVTHEKTHQHLCNTTHGVLVLLRWPADTSRREAPPLVQQAWELPGITEHTVYALLPEGATRAEVLAKLASASTAIHMLSLPTLPSELYDLIDRSFNGGPVLCRWRGHSPRSAVAWTKADLPELPKGRLLTLADLQDARAVSLLHAVQSSAGALRQTCTGQAAKSRRYSLNKVLEDTQRALQAASAAPTANSLPHSFGAARLFTDVTARSSAAHILQKWLRPQIPHTKRTQTSRNYRQ